MPPTICLPKTCRFALVLFPLALSAQQSGDFAKILERLDHLEQENRNLAAEVHALRSELAATRPGPPAAEPSLPSGSAQTAPAAAPTEEQVAVQGQRIEDLAQSKVEASQRLPVSLTGMVLFNAFMNGNYGGGQEYPTSAALSAGQPNTGGTVSQSVIGLLYQGPRVLGGAQVNANLLMDLWGGNPSNSLAHTVRMRIATVSLNWKTRSLSFGQDRPISSPREPDSLAQVAFSPLAAAGNLWLWQPQVRFEQRFDLGENMGLRAQAGVYQTSEPVSNGGTEYAATVSPSRPARQGRFEFWRDFGKTARLEIAPGFHASETHVAGISIPSRLFTVDWLVQPVFKVRITGMFFQGQNAAGLGGLRQGFTVKADNHVTPVHAEGGWAQIAFQATPRLTFRFYSGQESDRTADLLTGQISRNFLYAGNTVYRLGSNVLVGLEASQVRTTFAGLRNRMNNHYDLSLAYLF